MTQQRNPPKQTTATHPTATHPTGTPPIVRPTPADLERLRRPVRMAHLHQHTQYSLLDGAAREDELLTWVAAQGGADAACAITDHGNMHGAVHFWKAAHKRGVRPILGCEVYVVQGDIGDTKQPTYHLTLLAQNLQGYRNLCRLNALSWTQGMHGKPRVSHNWLAECAGGVIALSGCLGAEVPQLLIASEKARRTGDEASAETHMRRAWETMAWYAQTFPGRYFVEMQRHSLMEDPHAAEHSEGELGWLQGLILPKLSEMARALGLGRVATNDGHYVKAEDEGAHETLLAIQTRAKMSDAKRFKFPCGGFHVKTPGELAEMLPPEQWGEELYDNTLLIASMCDPDYLPVGQKRVYQLPMTQVQSGQSELSAMTLEVMQGLEKRYPALRQSEIWQARAQAALTDSGGARNPGEDDKQLIARLQEAAVEACLSSGTRLPAIVGRRPEWDTQPDSSPERLIDRALYEVGVIGKMGFAGYFRIVAEYVNWARDAGIHVGEGRGSGPGSIVAYALEITGLDPIEHGLLFERFLNPDRVSMPDFDVDFDDRRRHEVAEHIREVYGDERVASIATFQSLQSKAAFSDVCRTLDIPQSEYQEVTKLIPIIMGKALTLDRAERDIEGIKAILTAKPHLKEAWEVAKKIEGIAKARSTHAAGLVIGAGPLQDLIPLMRDSRSPVAISQYDMKAVEEIGLVKMDLLGLRTLSLIAEVTRLIDAGRRRTWELRPDNAREQDAPHGQTPGKAFDITRIPLDDAAAFRLISRGDTAGVFQLEGSGITQAARSMRPRTLQDIIALGALYRPGPMENIPTYVRRMHGEEEISYRDFPSAEAALRPILDVTYGIPVYQEQIMQIASDVAGYTLGEADLLRRCVAEGTIIVDAETGRRIPVEQVRPGMKVWSLDAAHRLVTVPVQEVMDNGSKPVFQVRTRSGRHIELTGDHPLLTVQGWRHLSDLAIGASIAVPRETRTPDNAATNPARRRVLAMLITDGNTVHGPSGKAKATFYSKEEQAALDFEQSVETLGGATRRSVHAQTGVISVHCRRNAAGHDPIKALVEEVGIAHLAHDQHVPEETFSYNRDDLEQFLGDMWNADGSVEKLRVSYSTSSPAMANDVAELLLRLGLPTIRITRKSARRDKIQLIITDQHLIPVFARTIGKHLQPRKAQSLEKLLEKVRERNVQSGMFDIPAEFATLLARDKAASKLSWSQAGEKIGLKGSHLSSGISLRKHNARKVSRHRMQRLGEAFGSDELLRLAQSDVLWDPITSIEASGDKRVYDLSVPPHHNFVASDIVVHNSMGKKIAAEMAVQRDIFTGKAVGRGLPEAEMQRLFGLLEKFASYGFNRSHSAAYGLISYQTAYLKANWPLEFWAGLMTTEQGDIRKLASYVALARDSGVEVLPPSVLESGLTFTPIPDPSGKTPGTVLFGLSAIKGVSPETAACVIEARQRGADLSTLHGFTEAFPADMLKKDRIQAMIDAGAMDHIDSRAAMSLTLETQIEERRKSERKRAQIRKKEEKTPSIFGGSEADKVIVKQVDMIYPLPPADERAEMAERQREMRREFEALEIYLSGHPVEVSPLLFRLPTIFASDLAVEDEGDAAPRPQQRGSRELMAVQVEKIEPINSRSGAMARLRVSDPTGHTTVVVFPDSWRVMQHQVVEGELLAVLGNPGREGGELIGAAAIGDAELNARMESREASVFLTSDEPEQALQDALKACADNPGSWEATLLLTGPGSVTHDHRLGRTGPRGIVALEKLGATVELSGADELRSYLAAQIPKRSAPPRRNGS